MKSGDRYLWLRLPGGIRPVRVKARGCPGGPLATGCEFDAVELMETRNRRREGAAWFRARVVGSERQRYRPRLYYQVGQDSVRTVYRVEVAAGARKEGAA